MNSSAAIRMKRLLGAMVCVFVYFAVVSPLWAATGVPGDLAFLLSGPIGSCTAFYWRPLPGQPGRAYFLSAGHCWQERYSSPSGVRIVWAKVPGDRPTFIDILVGETDSPRVAITWSQELAETPKVGDVHMMLAVRSSDINPRFERRRLTFRQNLGDAYVYDADKCVSPGYSGAPVLTEDGRLVGIVILGNSKLCKRLYAVPMSVLYAFRPDLRP